MNEELRLESKSGTRYRVEHRDARGKLKGTYEFHNTIPTGGLNKMVDAVYATGIASPAWYIGFVDGGTTPTFDPADTLDSHSGWTENTDYAEYAIGGRPAFVPGTVADGAVDNSDSRAAFTITVNGAIAGCFMTDQATGTSGVLLGEGAFAAGIRGVEIGDTLRVTATGSITD